MNGRARARAIAIDRRRHQLHDEPVRALQRGAVEHVPKPSGSGSFVIAAISAEPLHEQLLERAARSRVPRITQGHLDDDA